MENITLEYVDVFDDNTTKELVLSKHLIHKEFNQKSLFALLVDGKSMQPVINDRAVIVADLSAKELVHDAIYLLYYGEKMWVKKYDEKKEIFFSINPNFSHLVYPQNKIHLVARVVLTFTNL
jgi:phage repressor protein C with HTH and peptisase S24 domain